MRDEGVLSQVAYPVRVEGGARHRVDFGFDKGVGVAVDCWVDAEGDDMLVVSC